MVSRAWMAPIFEFHGLSVDCIDKHKPNSEGRRQAYNADITYGTNNEFGFDYLRDNMKMSLFERVQRGHHYAIIDEVEAVVTDEMTRPQSSERDETVAEFRAAAIECRAVIARIAARAWPGTSISGITSMWRSRA